MTPESPVLAELRPLLDSLCEETITPEQLRRLEELVLAHPEAEAEYLRFMSFHAALIAHVAGLPEPKTADAKPEAPPAPAEPAPKPEKKPVRTRRARAFVAWSVLLALVGLGATQLLAWNARASALRDAQAALNASQAEFAGVQAAAEAARKETRKDADAALGAEAELAKQYWAAREAARKGIESKDFVVRLTGPERAQPGAPNRWQIETLRHGAVGRPKRLDVVVKDAGGTELLRQSHEKPPGAATLALGADFWEKVKPGAELFLEVVAYNDADGKSVLAERLPLSRPVFVTHLATDKPLYQPGETLRFRSLTLDRSTLRPPARDLHLVFKLRDPANTVVPLDAGNGRLLRDLQPVLGPDGQPLRGIGVGEYAIPAEAPGGEYELRLYEVNAETRKEVLLETRKFVVNRYVPDVFEKKLEFDGKSYGPGEFVQARIEVSRTAGGPMPNAKAHVVASADGKTFHEQKDATFTAITDANGTTKTVLDLRFKLPADPFDKKDAPNAMLSVSIRDGSDAEAIVRPIPLVTKSLQIEFFPEGGEMIAGVPGRVYFMVRTPHNKPADIKGTISDGTNTVAEVATLTDAENPGVNRGHGVFTLTPQPGKRYFLKLASPAGINPPTKDGWALPVAKADGVALTALDAVTPRGGAVRVRLQSPTGPKTLHVGAYVRERLIAQQKVTAEANRPVEVSLQGDEAAGGVTRVTVFEEAKDDAGRVRLVPRAERLVFRGAGDHLALQVTADKARHTPSGKVRLDLAASTEKGKPMPAVLMVAVVNRSVVTMADNKTDRLMPTHFLLAGDVKDAADLEHADFLLTDHPKAGVALDLLLGTQGWRRFAEQEAAPPAPAHKADVEKMLAAHGQRPGAPLQLFKLEEQRLNAEFAPKLEVARLRSAAAEAAWQALPSPMAAQVLDARTAVSRSEAQREDAAESLERLQEWYARIGFMLGALLAAAGAFFALRWLLARAMSAASRPAQTTYAAALTVGIVLFAAVFLFGTQYAARKAEFSPAGPAAAERQFEADRELAAEQALSGAARRRSTNERDFAVGHWAGAGMPMPEPSAPPLFDPIGQPEAPNTDSTALTPPGLSPADLLRQVARAKTRNDLYKPRTARPNAQADKQRLAAALRPRRPEPGPEIDLAVPSITDELRPRLDKKPVDAVVTQDPIPAAEELVLTVPPFIVREYAHRRDESLGEVRADFTETVYWHPALVLPQSGKASVEFQLSDDIARYQVLVAGHTLDGRIGAVTQTVEARKPFSVDPKMPLEVAHTDTIDVPLRVTNDSDARRAVSLKTTAGGFKAHGNLADAIELGPNASGRKLLRLTPSRLDGFAALLVEGTSGAEKDSIARTIRVVPDGFPRIGSVSDTLEAGRGRGVVRLPKDVVPGSLRVRLEMYPTSMADLLKGLEGMLQEPYGCFEQTSTTNYPNTLVLDYLNQTNQAKPEVAKRAKALLEKGYGRLTSFECPDTPTKSKQGFEWFGQADNQHEALTAYGLLQFKDMARVHPVDPKLIERTQQFLLSRRDGKGGFRQNRRALHSWGASERVVNAYIVWALVESDPDDAEKLDLRTELAALKAEALDASTAGGKDAYFVAIAANALLLRNDRAAAHALLDRLKEKHFAEGRVTGAATSVTCSRGRDLEIETTALALLAWLRANDPTYATTIKAATKWISQQRGGHGSFGSTQSTILALKALTLHAKKSAHPAEAGELKLVVGGKVVASRRFTEKDVEVIALDVPNAEAVFKPGEAIEVEVATDAKHPYPFALSYSYTTLTPESAAKCAVRLGTMLAKAEAAEGETVPLSVTLENRLKQGHGMAVAVVGIPAGLKVPTDVKQLADLREKGVIAFFEVRGRELVLYWRELAPEQKVALTVDLVCDVPGKYRGPASRAYLYYDADHKHWVEPLSITIAPAGGKE